METACSVDLFDLVRVQAAKYRLKTSFSKHFTRMGVSAKGQSSFRVDPAGFLGALQLLSG